MQIFNFQYRRLQQVTFKDLGKSSDPLYFRSRGCMNWYPSTTFLNTHIVYDSNNEGIDGRKEAHFPWAVYQCLEVMTNIVVELFLLIRLTSNPAKKEDHHIGRPRRGSNLGG